MSKPFYLVQNRASGVWYVRFVDEVTGKLITAKSTGETHKRAAEKVAFEWLASGFTPKRHNAKTSGRISIEIKNLIAQLSVMNLEQDDAAEIIKALKNRNMIESVVYARSDSARPFTEYLTEFWDWDNSPYVKDKKMYGQSIHKYYVGRNAGYIKMHWEPYFPDRSLGSITRQDIKAFMQSLVDKKLSAESVNQITRCGTAALRWAFNNGLTSNDCFTGLTFCAVRHKKREVLTMEQAAAVFRVDWSSDYSRLANMTAMCTGMRAGEIQALRVQDIGVDRLYIRHNWARGSEGLKSCKNGEEREVPIPPVLRDMLLRQAEKNPYNEGIGGFVFFGLLPGQPMDSKPWLTALRRALKQIGYAEPNKIVFHAWRHLYAARMADVIDQRKLQLATGHKTAAMLEHYANHKREEDFSELASSSQNVFLPVIN